MRRCILIDHGHVDMSYLSRQIRSGDVLLPLGIEDRAALSRQFDLVCSLSEIVPYERICQLALQAQDVLAEFAATACLGETLDGIDWPQVFVADSQLFYFRELLMGEELANSLKEKYDEVVWVGGMNYPVHFPLQGFLEILRSSLGDRFSAWPQLSATNKYLVLQRIKTKFRYGFQTLHHLFPLFGPPIERKKGIAIFATSEWTIPNVVEV